MNFIQPSIDPVIISIGFIEIRWYSLAYILGFLLGIYECEKFYPSFQQVLFDDIPPKEAIKFSNFEVIGRA